MKSDFILRLAPIPLQTGPEWSLQAVWHRLKPHTPEHYLTGIAFGLAPRPYLLTTAIVFGLTASAFGMLKVSSPFSYLASALSASTGMLMLSVRWNLP